MSHGQNIQMFLDTQNARFNRHRSPEKSPSPVRRGIQSVYSNTQPNAYSFTRYRSPVKNNQRPVRKSGSIRSVSPIKIDPVEDFDYHLSSDYEIGHRPVNYFDNRKMGIVYQIPVDKGKVSNKMKDIIFHHSPTHYVNNSFDDIVLRN